jgi:hypothetical protein
MGRWVLLIGFLATMAFQWGCGDGVAYTRRERMHRADVIFENDMKQLNDDWDLFLQNDRKSRLSRWSTD